MGYEDPGQVEGIPAHSRRAGTRWPLSSLPTQTLPQFYFFLIQLSLMFLGKLQLIWNYV